MNLDPLRSEVVRRDEVQSEPMPEPASLSLNGPRWNPLFLILFRFLFIYWIVYILPFPVHDIPRVGHQWAKSYEDSRDEVITWTAKNVFDKTITIKTNGS